MKNQTKNIYRCEICDYNTSIMLEYKAHLRDHPKTDDNAQTLKKCLNFYCEKCDFIANDKKDYSRHLATRKHTGHMSKHGKSGCPKSFKCPCGKNYAVMSSLSRHKKNCNQKPSDQTIAEYK